MDSGLWALWITVRVLALVGIAVIAWGLFWDRSRGRRRCPRCWYNMGGIPGRVCPECGHAAAGERGLLRTRRRWRRVTVGVFVLFLSWAGSFGYDAWQNGWVRAVPTTAMLLIFPLLDAPTAAEESALGGVGGAWVPIGMTAQGLPLPGVTAPAAAIAPVPALAPAPATKIPWRKVLHHDLVQRRLVEDQLWWWQRRWLVERCVGGDSRHRLGSPEWHESRLPILARLHYAAEAAKTDAPMPLRPPAKGVRVGRRELERIRYGLAVGSIQTRPQWPLGEEVRVKVDADLYRGRFWRRLEVRARLPEAEMIDAHAAPSPLSTVRAAPSRPPRIAGRAEREQRHVEFDVQLIELGWDETNRLNPRVIFESVVRHPTALVGKPENVVEGVMPEGLGRTIGRWYRPTLVSRDIVRDTIAIMPFTPGGPIEAEWQAMAIALAAYSDVALAVRFELCRDGVVVAVGQASWRCGAVGDPGVQHPLRAVVLLRVLSPPAPDLAAPGTWTLRMIGDPAAALRDLESTRYWRGEIEARVDPPGEAWR